MHNNEFILMYNLTHTPAEGCVISQDSNVCPGGGVPVGEIVPLLWALITVAISVGILTGVDGSTDTESVVVLQFLVCREQTFEEELTNLILVEKDSNFRDLHLSQLPNYQQTMLSLLLLIKHQFQLAIFFLFIKNQKLI